jgi:hypothetical protein
MYSSTANLIQGFLIKELGLEEVEYVGHLVCATRTSFTPEKRLEVLDFLNQRLKRECSKTSDSRDHVPNMTKMVKPLRDMIPIGKNQRTDKLHWTTEDSAAFKLSIGGYFYMVTNGKVGVLRFFKVGAQLNWSTREKE